MKDITENTIYSKCLYGLWDFSKEEYLLYKLCVFYNAQTEIFDRGLTSLRSRYDPTEAFVVGENRRLSSAYAFNMYQFIRAIALKSNININYRYFSKKFHFSAQQWIDEYNRLKENGEMDFIYEDI